LIGQNRVRERREPQQQQQRRVFHFQAFPGGRVRSLRYHPRLQNTATNERQLNGSQSYASMAGVGSTSFLIGARRATVSAYPFSL
jgi:hypothetical protein